MLHNLGGQDMMPIHDMNSSFTVVLPVLLSIEVTWSFFQYVE